MSTVQQDLDQFGGWHYELGNQDHSFMQGVEVSDLIMRGEKICYTYIIDFVNQVKRVHYFSVKIKLYKVGKNWTVEWQWMGQEERCTKQKELLETCGDTYLIPLTLSITTVCVQIIVSSCFKWAHHEASSKVLWENDIFLLMIILTQKEDTI